jgi:RHS repeat-associated protein
VIEAAMNNGTNIHDFKYDPIGNRRWSQLNAVTNNYAANQLNQYSAVSGGMSANLTHDDDGNMIWDGSFYHRWDVENRNVRSEPGGYYATNGSVLVENKYDYMNRRVRKVVKQLSDRGSGYPMDPSQPGTWDAVETRVYIWDGWNIIAEHITDHVETNSTMNTYTWGLDLSGTLQGAGGVGGLLGDTKISNTGTNTFYSVGDANGNVTEYVDDTGAVKAHYEYSVTGEEVYSSGSMKNDFTHRFSTKPFDPETGLVQYQYRPYDAPNARWLSRDPIEEAFAPGLYLFLENDTINYFDYLGLNKAGGPEGNKKWHEKVLTYGESHRYGCDEWKNYSGKADRSSYYGHFKDITLQAHSNVYPAISSINRSYIANELLDLIGIRSGYIWQLDLGKTSLFYTDKTLRSDSSCRSGQRYYIEIKVRTNVQYLEKKDKESCCTLKKFDPKNTTALETGIWEQAGDCVK